MRFFLKQWNDKKKILAFGRSCVQNFALPNFINSKIFSAVFNILKKILHFGGLYSQNLKS